MISDSRRCALITGLGGQDGSFLAERLVEEGWEVHGLSWRREFSDTDMEVAGTRSHTLDPADATGLTTLVRAVSPTHVFHLAGVSSVWQSWQQPVYATEINALCTVALYAACLDLQEQTGLRTIVVNASSGEIFAGSGVSPQTESTPVVPISPYGATKAFGFHMARVFRTRGLRVSSAILYNHESPRRPETFVTRKITKGVVDIVRGRSDTITLGNIDAPRDWGWAPDVVDCLYRMGQREEPNDYVVATGVAHTVRDFVRVAFDAVGITEWESHVVFDSQLARPTEPALMVGDASKARNELGWNPTMGFEDIVRAMVAHDVADD